MDIRLIALDLDGTLLNNKKEISQRNLKALRDCIDRGIFVAIASGRRLSDVTRISDTIAPDLPFICANGAAAYLSKPFECVYCETIEQKDLRKVVDVFEKEKIYYQVYVDDGSVMVSRFKEIFSYANYENMVMNNGDEMVKYVGDGALKIICIDDDEKRIEKMRKVVSDLHVGEINSSWKNNIEVMAKGVSKGSALTALAERLGLAPEQCMAFGDNENDIGMLKAAGLSVCMANGTYAAKAAANYITLTNEEDGVAYAIDKYILNPEAND